MDFAFTKKNYILLISGLAFIISGLILMIGGGSEDPTKFSYEIFNFQRLTVQTHLEINGIMNLSFLKTIIIKI